MIDVHRAEDGVEGFGDEAFAGVVGAGEDGELADADDRVG